MKKIKLFITIVVFSLCSIIQAQITLEQTTPSLANTCDTSQFSVIINSITNQNNLSLFIDLEDAVQFNTTSPYVSLGNGLYEFFIASIVAGTPFILDYSVYLPCSMMDITNAIGGNGGSYIQTDSLWLEDSQGNGLATLNSIYDIANSNLFTSPNDPNLNIQGHQGQTIIRDVAFFNSQNNFTGAFTYETNLDCDSLVVLDSLVLMQNENILQSFVDTNYFEFANSNLSGNFINDSIHILEYYSIIGCIDSCTNDGFIRNDIEISWGCNLNDLCNTILLEGTIERDDSAPLVSVYRILPDLEDIEYSNWCV